VAQGRYVEACDIAKRAVAIGPDAGAHYATALHNLAAVFESEGRLSEARQYYEKALEARQAYLPAGHAHTELTRAALARVVGQALLAAAGY
jgi:tetratricopeptide (TPR) repeat protein